MFYVVHGTGILLSRKKLKPMQVVTMLLQHTHEIHNYRGVEIFCEETDLKVVHFFQGNTYDLIRQGPKPHAGCMLKALMDALSCLDERDSRILTTEFFVQ